LLFHPVIIRASANFSSCAVDGNRLPGGQNNAVEFAFEALLYRGTKRFTAYLGGGPIYSTNNFRLSRQLNDSLLAQSAVYKTEIEDKYGFRLTMGFRLAENYSFEFGFQELRPSFVFRGRSSEQGEIAIYRPSKLSTVRFTLGYIFAL
jgi:hypothetical protein